MTVIEWSGDKQPSLGSDYGYSADYLTKLLDAEKIPYKIIPDGVDKVTLKKKS